MYQIRDRHRLLHREDGLPERRAPDPATRGPDCGVVALGFDLQQHRLTVTHRLDDVSPVTAALVKLGLPPSGLEEVHTEAFHVSRMDCKNEVAQIRERLGQIAACRGLALRPRAACPGRSNTGRSIRLRSSMRSRHWACPRPRASQLRSQSDPPSMCRRWIAAMRSGRCASACKAYGIEDLESTLPVRR